jgi:hypothetical protein
MLEGLFILKTIKLISMDLKDMGWEGVDWFRIGTSGWLL